MDPVFVIAEVSQTHDGSLGQAHAFIDAVGRTGADAIKFQTHIAAAESTPEEPFRVKFSYQDATRYEYWKRMEFTPEQWRGLKQHAEKRGLVFLSSPFSPQAIDLLQSIGVTMWKVSSGEIGSRLMLNRMIDTGKPLLISTGMSGYAELDTVVAYLKERRVDFTLMQCTTSYPSPLAEVGLNVLAEYRSRYGCPVGLSDHSATIWPSVAAAALGASVVEVHVTLSRDMFGPDVKSSVTIDELAMLVQGVRAVGTMQANPVDKDAQAEKLAPLRKIFGKSAVARHDARLGSMLSLDNVDFKKPGGGIDEGDLVRYITRPLARDVAAGAFLKPEDFAE